MRTVPLRGKKAAGRVALVDDEDYEFVMQYKWRITEPKSSGRLRAAGPYAMTTYRDGDRWRNTQMHILIMGRKGIDHIDHNGLNNQRSNLRPATQSQNNMNQRPQTGRSSQYKGVFWVKTISLWRAGIVVDGKRRNLGDFLSELEAAYIYDAAAREHFGEFACPNFSDIPTQAMRDQWRAERAARDAVVAAETSRKISAHNREWLARREVSATCQECGGEYTYKSLKRSIYCPPCRPVVNARYGRAWRAAKAAARQEGRLF